MDAESRNTKILVVDDTHSTIDMVKTALEEDGYEVVMATSGEKAIKRAEITSPDLIMLDVLMPGMDGFETCRRLKADNRTRDIPVIFMTALTATESKVTGFKVGGVDYVTKPIEVEEVLARIRTHLTIQSMQRRLESQNERLRHEMTERKQAEEALQRSHEKLKAANRELGDFAYIVSHDLKAPLRSITQLAGWLFKDYAQAFDPEGQNMVELLINRTQRMERLIDGVLQYSRVGRIKGKTEAVDLNILVDQVIEMLAPPDNILVTVDGRLPVVEAEKIRLEQIFQNLIGNAVKFMDKEQGEVKIRCVQEGDYWKFSVEDNGPGIEERYYGQIFQIFQTLLPRDVMENTGAGLTIVKKIIELYNGRIWVESELGKGSTFYFTLPK
jgi:light-regulated signal transduction histidine kinase (bacteriophytochrome)